MRLKVFSSGESFLDKEANEIRFSQSYFLWGVSCSDPMSIWEISGYARGSPVLVQFRTPHLHTDERVGHSDTRNRGVPVLMRS